MLVISRRELYRCLAVGLMVWGGVSGASALGAEMDDPSFDAILSAANVRPTIADPPVLAHNTNGLLLGADADKLNGGDGDWGFNWFDDLDGSGAHDPGEPFADDPDPAWATPVKLPDQSCWISSGCNMLAEAGANGGDEQGLFEQYSLEGVPGPDGELLTWDESGLQEYVLDHWIGSNPELAENLTYQVYRPQYISPRLSGVFFWEEVDARTMAADALTDGKQVAVGIWPWYPNVHLSTGHALTMASVGDVVVFPYTTCLVTDSDRDHNMGRNLQDTSTDPPELPEFGDYNEYDGISGYGPTADGVNYGYWVMSYYAPDYLWPGGDIGYLVILEGSVPSGVVNEEAAVAVVPEPDTRPEPVATGDRGVIKADIFVDLIEGCNGFGLWLRVLKDGQELNIDASDPGHSEITFESIELHQDLIDAVDGIGATLIDIGWPGPMISRAVIPPGADTLGPNVSGGVATVTLRYDDTAAGFYEIELADDEQTIGSGLWSTKSYFTFGTSFDLDYVPLWLMLGPERMDLRTLDFSSAVVDIRIYRELIVVDGSGGGKDYHDGEVVPVSAEERLGYRFNGWTVEPAEMALNVADIASAETTITMLDDATLTPTYLPDVKLSIVPEIDLLLSYDETTFYADVFIDHVDGCNGFGMTAQVFRNGVQLNIDPESPNAAEITFSHAELHPDLIETMTYAGATPMELSSGGTNISYAIIPADPHQPGPTVSGGIVRYHFNIESAPVGTYELRVDDAEVNLGGGIRGTKSYLSTGDAYSSASIPSYVKAGPRTFHLSYMDFGTAFVRSGVYNLTVNGGTGGGAYEEGDEAMIEADVPPGKVFERWLVSPESLASYVGDVTAPSTTVAMYGDMTITAALAIEASLSIIPQEEPFAGGSGQFYVDVYVDMIEGCNGFGLSPLVVKNGLLLNIDPDDPDHDAITFDHAELHDDLIEAVESDRARFINVANGNAGEIGFAIIPIAGHKTGPTIMGGVVRFYFNYDSPAGTYEIAMDDAEETVGGGAWSTASYFSSGTAYTVAWIPQWFETEYGRFHQAYLNFESVQIRADVLGDVNQDGCVNVADLLLVRNGLGLAGSAISPPEADLNSDDIINVADLLIVRNALGGGNCSQSADE